MSTWTYVNNFSNTRRQVEIAKKRVRSNFPLVKVTQKNAV